MKHAIKTEKQREKIPAGKTVWHSVSPGRSVGYRKYEVGGIFKCRNGHIYTLPNSQNYSWDEALAAAVTYWTADEAPVTYTIQQGIDDYVKSQRAKSLKAEVDSRRRLENKLPDVMRNMDISDITLTMLEEWRDAQTHGTGEELRKSRVTCNRVLATCKAMLNKAYKAKHITTDEAWRHLAAFKGVNKSRTLFLTQTEVKSLLDASEGAIHDLIQGCVLLGHRMGEARDCTVADIDLRMNTITLDGKTQERTVQMSKAVRAHVQTMIEGKAPHEPVWASDDGFKWKAGQHSVPFAKAARKAGLPNDAVLYSLRHYFISRCVTEGLPALAISKHCGNSVAMIEQTYAHFQPDALVAMMDRVAL